MISVKEQQYAENPKTSACWPADREVWRHKHIYRNSYYKFWSSGQSPPTPVPIDLCLSSSWGYIVHCCVPSRAFLPPNGANLRKKIAIPSSGSADIRRCALHSTPQPCSCWQQSRYNLQSSPTSSRTSRASSALHEISQIGSSVEHINLQCSLYLSSLYRSATKFRLRFDIDLWSSQRVLLKLQKTELKKPQDAWNFIGIMRGSSSI